MYLFEGLHPWLTYFAPLGLDSLKSILKCKCRTKQLTARALTVFSSISRLGGNVCVGDLRLKYQTEVYTLKAGWDYSRGIIYQR